MLLYLIEILHQTTTGHLALQFGDALYLIEILHQTTTHTSPSRMRRGCILSKFYIKPQPLGDEEELVLVVSYRNSTSNHNLQKFELLRSELYLIEILHQTTTIWKPSKKPMQLYLIEILHQTTTPLHTRYNFIELYLIEILHQTTTFLRLHLTPRQLYLIEILHQTTTEKPFDVSVRELYLIEILHQTTTSGLILIDKVLLTGCLPL